MQFFDNKIFIALCVMLFLAPQALWAPKLKNFAELQKYVASLGVTLDENTDLSDEQAQRLMLYKKTYKDQPSLLSGAAKQNLASLEWALFDHHQVHPARQKFGVPEDTTLSLDQKKILVGLSNQIAGSAPQLSEHDNDVEKLLGAIRTKASAVAPARSTSTSTSTTAPRTVGEADQGADRARTSSPIGVTSAPLTADQKDTLRRSKSMSKLTRTSKPSSTTAAGDEHATATAEGSGRPAAQPARVASGGSTLHVVVQPSTIKSSVASEDSPTSLALVPSSPTKSSSTWSVGSFDSEDSEDPSSRTVAAPAVKLRRNEIGSRGAAFRARLAPKTREELLRGLESYGKSSRETEIAAKLEKLSENISGHEQAGTLHATVGATSTTNAQALEDKLFALKHEHAKAFGTKQDRAELKKEYQELLKSRKAASRQAAAPKEPPHSAPEASPQTPPKTSPHSPGSTFGKTVSHARRQPAQR